MPMVPVTDTKKVSANKKQRKGTSWSALLSKNISQAKSESSRFMDEGQQQVLKTKKFCDKGEVCTRDHGACQRHTRITGGRKAEEGREGTAQAK